MTHSPEDYWQSFEPQEPVSSLTELLTFVAGASPDQRTIVWRGVKNQAWPLHSSLYRFGIDKLKRRPNDSDFLKLERWVVKSARQWGLDRVPGARSGLELLAWMQHTGSPTRLLDVTFNPLVAAWFACEDDAESDRPVDGRLFAIGSTAEPIVDDGRSALPWEDPDSANYDRLSENLTSLWQPPSLDPRIAAQSGAFLIGPLPRKTSGGNWYNDGESSSRYTLDEIRSLTSIPIRAYKSVKTGTVYKKNPLISVRILASAKQVVREQLETVFNLKPLLLFPDPYGLAGHLRRTEPKL